MNSGVRGRRIALQAACCLALTSCVLPASHTPERGREIRKGDHYVALGDSYTAAYLTGPLDPASGGCLRSLDNYPHRLADSLGLELTDVSCGGAATEDVTKSQRPSAGDVVAPQLDAVDKSTDLVTIGLGGNDFNLFGALVVSCAYVAQSDPQGAPCTKLAERNPRGKRNLEAIEDRLVRVVQTVSRKAPKARILLIGYPQAFPESGGCDQVPLAAGDIPFAHAALRALNDVVATAARKSGAEYVDVWTPSAGHDICSADPWVAGATPTRTDGTPYHPFPEEQELVASVVRGVLENKGSGAKVP